MNQSIWLEKTELMVRAKLEADSSGHDWWHINRVRNLAKRLAIEEGVNIFIVEMSALLHDICDWKFNNGDEQAGVEIVRKFLIEIQLPNNLQNEILHIISNVSYKGANSPDKMPSLEGKVVQDADRLDALGAIGIARTFAYGGTKDQPMHLPGVAPVMHANFQEYKNKRSSSINHFYEKLFLLKDRLHTKSAMQIAEERHQFMVDFVDKFLLEWDGKA